MPHQDYSQFEALRDGSPVVVRTLTPDDKTALQEGLARLSDESSYSRFFYSKRKLSSNELSFFTELDFANHVAIGVGLLDEGETLPIGVGRYIVDRPETNTAEIALTVDDNFQGLGVGSLLLRHLVLIGKQNGVEEFAATVLESNQKMLNVFAAQKVRTSESDSSGCVDISLRLHDFVSH